MQSDGLMTLWAMHRAGADGHAGEGVLFASIINDLAMRMSHTPMW